MPDSIRDDVLSAALRYARRGWYVFPVVPGTKISYKSAEHNGGAKWGKTVDEDEIRADFARWPEAGVGMVTGPDSGMFVIDVDSPEGHEYNGIANWEELQDRHGEVPPTLMAKSPSGGLHYYFNWPSGIEVRNSTSRLAKGIDVRGRNGVIIAAPTIKVKNGVASRYTWTNNLPVADSPPWLLVALQEAARPVSRETSRENRTATDVKDLRAMMAVIPNDDRNWNEWNEIGMALWRTTGGSGDGLELFADWSAKSAKCNVQESPEAAWRRYRGSPPNMIGIAKLIWEANNADPSWRKHKAITVSDFHAYLPNKTYIFMPTCRSWNTGGVDSQLAPLPKVDEAGNPVLNAEGRQVKVKASIWLAHNRSVQEMTWSPNDAEVIENKVITGEGWINKPGAKTLNLYKAPQIIKGAAGRAGPWLDHADMLLGEHREHVLSWFAYKVQHPGKKINHAIVLGGAPGVGKDTLLEPVKEAVGGHNWGETTPHSIMTPFNPSLQSVILRVSETRDLGDVSRYQFYDRMKIYIAAPPDTIVINDKFIQEHRIPNCVGIIYTTNYKSNGLYLPPDDRRHYVVWSELTERDFSKEYWDELYEWYDSEGHANVAAYLSEFDLARFNPAAPPKKTDAFLAMVEGGMSNEDDQLADVIDMLGEHDDQNRLISRPEVITPAQIKEKAPLGADQGLHEWLSNRTSIKQFPYKMEIQGYVSVRAPHAKDGRWEICGKRTSVYVKRDFSPTEQINKINQFKLRIERESGHSRPRAVEREL
jgi:hypothetical protein